MNSSFPESSDYNRTNWSLLRAAADGEAEARAKFSQLYAEVVRGFLRARWRGRRMFMEIEDATSEVFLECLKPSGVLDRAAEGNGRFRSMIYAVARNVARRFEERIATQSRMLPEETSWIEKLASDEPGQQTEFDRSWARVIVRQALELHRARYAEDGGDARGGPELLERRFEGGESIAELSKAWGVPSQDLHNRYRKARQEFESCLRQTVAQYSQSGENIELECRRLIDLLA